MQEEFLDSTQKSRNEINPKELLFKYIRYLPWVIISVAIMLSIAYIQLRYTTRVYSVAGKLLVKKNSPYSSSSEKFDDIFMMQGSNNNMNDEIEIIKSRSMAARVAQSLGLQTQFFKKGKIKNPTSIHPSDMPFIFDVLSLVDSSGGFGLEITIVNDHQFQVNAAPALYSFGQIVHQPFGDFRLIKKASFYTPPVNSNVFIINRSPIEAIAAGLSGGIRVTQVYTYGNVLSLGYETDNTKMGLDIVNQFMLEYQKASLEDKRQTAFNTLSFIDEQLDTVKRELGDVELNLLNSREKLKMIDATAQSTIFFNELSESNKLLNDQELKISSLDLLYKYITDKKNVFEVVSPSLMIAEPILLQQVTEFNKLQSERALALKTTPA
ncbi:MAG: hypothetical protein JST39_17025, partial [Bacteroidetes bacterium]|nr:hypothetical protein [Bacteroidota bacterium]